MARGLKGWMVGRYEIKPTDFDANVAAITRLVNDDDLVIVAGGDGTAAMTINALIASGKDAVLGVLGYGNFNDIAGMLGIERAHVGVVDVGEQKQGGSVGVGERGANDRPMNYDSVSAGGVLEILANYEQGKIAQIYPLDIMIDGKHWRYAPSYMTIGMFARSTEVFDAPKVRRELQTGKKSRVFSILQLAKWYFKYRKQTFLPVGTLNGEAWPCKTTDYIALNGATMAGVMKGGEWYLESQRFLSSTQQLSSFWRLVKFMLGSMRERVPGAVHNKDVLEFAEPSEIELHAEGEYEKLSGVQRVEVGKSGKTVKVVIGDRTE